jgi:hypothetical protein
MIPSKSAIGIPGGLPPLQRRLPLRGLGTARQRGACGQATWRQPWGAVAEGGWIGEDPRRLFENRGQTNFNDLK